MDDVQCHVSNGTAYANIDLSEARTAARKALSIPDDAYVISNMGTICRRKQQHWLVDLLSQTKIKSIHNHPVFILLIGYDGKADNPYEADLKKYVSLANLTTQVLLIPKSSHPLSYAAAADLHTSLSTHESFPLNTLEVMCLGIPIMSTPAFGIREQLLFPGINGVLLPGVRNYNGFQNAIRDFFDMHNPVYFSADTSLRASAKQQLLKTWHTMGIEGMRTVQKYFTSHAMLPYYDQLLEQLVPSAVILHPALPRPQQAAAGAGAAAVTGPAAAPAAPSAAASTAHAAMSASGAAAGTGPGFASHDKVCVVMRFHGSQLNKSPHLLDNGQPKYNPHRWYNLEEAIRSIYFQMHSNWELLLVPSDSADITAVYSLLVRYNHYFQQDAEVAAQQAAELAAMRGNGNGKAGAGGAGAQGSTSGGAPGAAARYVRSNNFNKIRMLSYHDLLRTYQSSKHASFHQHLYNLTDMAIAQCSADAQWLLVTNGDNTYHETFFNHLDSSVDILAYDFYSRWYGSAASGGPRRPPCDRLMAQDHLPAEAAYNPTLPYRQQTELSRNALSCKVNKLARNQTDLGANVINLKKWWNEGHRYSNILSNDGSQDGSTMEILTANRWTSKRISVTTNGGATASGVRKCLYNHNPNYHSCIAMNNAMRWDDGTHTCYHINDLSKYGIKYKESKLHRCIVSHR